MVHYRNKIINKCNEYYGMPCGQNHCGYRIGREVYWLINMIKENTAVVMLDEGNPDCTRNSAREKKLKPINASCTFHQFNI